MGKPEDPEGYVALTVGEWGRRYGTVYLPRELWVRMPPVSHEIWFYVSEYGRVKLQLDVPIGRIEV
ncbi:MAG TPA: hypothetical protein PKO09_02325 [Anaerolineae bacterium]|nr:hypothetical protein [Anaerolineae bacterium]